MVPRDAVLADYRVQAISKDAPHPAAARLWQEFLFSDEGQNLLLQGLRPAGAHGGDGDARHARHRGGGRLPKATGEPVVLTIPQIDKARKHLRTHWENGVRDPRAGRRMTPD